MSNFMKIREVRAELFHADGKTDQKTDMLKLKVTFRDFAKDPFPYKSGVNAEAFHCSVLHTQLCKYQISNKGKEVQFALEEGMKAQRGSRVIGLLFL